MNGRRRAGVIGCTGLVGRELLRQLADDPRTAEVRAFARRDRPGDAPDARWHRVDFDQLADALPCEGLDVLYCALGTTIRTAGSREAFRQVDHDYVVAAAKAAKRAGVGHMLVVSAVGANPRSGVFYNRIKGEMEQDLRKLALPSLDIVRPSLLLGERAENRPGEAIGQALAPLFSPLLAGPLQRYRPIRAADVAAAMIALAREPLPGVRVHHLPL